MPTSLSKRLTLILGMKGMRKAQAGFRRLSATLAGVRKAALSVTLALGGIALILGSLAVSAAAKFQAAMVKSTAIMGKLSKEMQRDLESVARSVAKKTKFSAEEAAESYFFLASAGLSAAASIKVMPIVASFAQAGMFDMALATDLLTDAQSALGLTIRDDAVANMRNMIRVSDVLVKANVLANATVQQFSIALTSKAGPAMKAYNIELEEGVAVLAAFADQGIKAELAGNSFGRILRLMTTAAVKNVEAYKKFNVEIFDVEGNLNNMADIIGDIEEAFKDLSPRQKVVALDMLGFKSRVQGVIFPLIGTSKAIRQYEKELKISGATQEVADKQLKSFTLQMGLVKSEINDMAISLGLKLLPKILALAQKLPGLVDSFAEWVKQNKALLVGTFSIAVLTTAITLMVNPIFLAGVALVALGVAFVSFKKSMGDGGLSVDQIASKIERLREKITILQNKINKGGGVFSNLNVGFGPKSFIPFKTGADPLGNIARNKRNIKEFEDRIKELQSLDPLESGGGFLANFERGMDSIFERISKKMKDFFTPTTKGGLKIPKGAAAAIAKETNALQLAIERSVSGDPDLVDTIIPPTVMDRFTEILNALDSFAEKLEFIGVNFKIAFGMKGVAAFGAIKGAASGFYNAVTSWSKAFFSGETKRMLTFEQLSAQVWKSALAGALDAIAGELAALSKKWAIEGAVMIAKGIGFTNPFSLVASGVKLLALAAAAGTGAAVLSGAAAGIRQESAGDLASALSRPAPLTDAERAAGVTRPSGTGGATSRGGVTQLAAQNVTIAPQTTFIAQDGGIVAIGSGGIEEAEENLGSFIVQRVRAALEQGELNIQGAG